MSGKVHSRLDHKEEAMVWDISRTLADWEFQDKQLSLPLV
jgi:hypothetical protein